MSWSMFWAKVSTFFGQSNTPSCNRNTFYFSKIPFHLEKSDCIMKLCFSNKQHALKVTLSLGVSLRFSGHDGLQHCPPEVSSRQEDDEDDPWWRFLRGSRDAARAPTDRRYRAFEFPSEAIMSFITFLSRPVGLQSGRSEGPQTPHWREGNGSSTAPQSSQQKPSGPPPERCTIWTLQSMRCFTDSLQVVFQH